VSERAAAGPFVGKVSLTEGVPSAWAGHLTTLGELLPPHALADARKVTHALGDVAVELAKADPDRAEVGEALGRALRYARLGGPDNGPEPELRAAVAAFQTWLGTEWTDRIGRLIP
jgi:hypothetical protein